MARAIDEATMEACFGDAPDAVSIFDPEGRCVFANAAAVALLERTDVRGRTLRELDVPARVRDAIDGARAAVLADGAARTVETDTRSTCRRARHRVSAMRDPDGRAVGAVVVTREVESGAPQDVQADAQRRIEGAEAERAAAELERARCHQLMLHAPALVAIMRGPDHVYEFVNERFVRTIPEAQRLVGTSARKHRANLVEQQFLDLLDHVYETGEPYEAAEVPLVVPQDGGGSETIYLTFIYQPIRRGDDTIEGIVTFAFDVTESVLARKQVEEASRAKDEFLSTLSHELRTPLNAIVGWSHLLRTNALDAAQSQRALEAIDRNARVQKRLIDDLLDFARMVSGKLGLHVAPIDLVSVVSTAVDTIRPSVGAKNVSLTLDVESRPTIVGDPDRLQQVVWNLLSNAVKFTGPRGCVSIEVATRGAVAEISVTDDGVGIDAPFLSSVFERFRQADSSTTRRHGGLGLGLAIARSIIELHGGTVTAESEGLGRGTTVRVRLPLRDEERGAVVERRAAPALAASRLHGVRVLVVDDEEDARALAHTALHESEFDVIVSDIGMPELDGITLIQRVRALPPPVSRIPAIAVTAYARTEDRDRAVGAGYDAFLTKPIEVDELGALVARLTGA